MVSAGFCSAGRAATDRRRAREDDWRRCRQTQYRRHVGPERPSGHPWHSYAGRPAVLNPVTQAEDRFPADGNRRAAEGGMPLAAPALVLAPYTALAGLIHGETVPGASLSRSS